MNRTPQGPPESTPDAVRYRAMGVIAGYLANAPEQGDWPWADHLIGLGSGSIAALNRAGLVVVEAAALAALAQQVKATVHSIGNAAEAADALHKAADPGLPTMDDLFGSDPDAWLAR